MGHVLGFTHDSIELMGDTLDVGVRIMPAVSSAEQLATLEDVSGAIDSQVPVNKNKSLSQKLKAKLSRYSVFNDSIGSFGPHSLSVDDEKKDDFLIFSDSKKESKERTVPRYVLLEEELNDEGESFIPASEEKVEDGKASKKASAKIDWSI